MRQVVVALMIFTLKYSHANAGECFRDFGVRKQVGSDWQIAALQDILRKDKAKLCNVIAIRFKFAWNPSFTESNLVVLDLDDREMYRLRADHTIWESWVGVSRDDILALPRSQGAFRIGYYAVGMSSIVEVSKAIEDFLSEHAIDFAWGVRSRR